MDTYKDLLEWYCRECIFDILPPDWHVGPITIRIYNLAPGVHEPVVIKEFDLSSCAYEDFMGSSLMEYDWRIKGNE